MSKASTHKARVAEEAWASVGELMEVWRATWLGLGSSLRLTPGEMKALDSLDADEPQPMRVLADAWSCDASNVTWLVDRLEGHGLVTRQTSTVDRRVKSIALTSEGVETQALIRRRLQAPPAELLELNLSELEVLRDALERVASVIRGKEQATAAGG